MEVRLFGELEALDGGAPVPVRGAKQRALLARLALQGGQPVSADRLIDLLWGGRRAANPANALQTQIGQLRRTLGPAAILTTEAGYALTAGPDEVDVVRLTTWEILCCPPPCSRRSSTSRGPGALWCRVRD
ncbi:MAG: AfsR/SARP family transcriptional regulator [Streptosporangiaceae bacterium]